MPAYAGHSEGRSEADAARFQQLLEASKADAERPSVSSLLLMGAVGGILFQITNQERAKMKARTKPITYVLGFLLTGPLLAGSLVAGEVDANCCGMPITDAAIDRGPTGAGPMGAGAETGTIVLNFEGLGNLEVIGGFYAGELAGDGSGPGPDFGITFSPNGLASISVEAGGTGNFLNNPAGDTALFFLEGTETVMNVPAGFQTGFSFAYSAAFEPGVVRVYDDVDGQGDLLAELNLPLTPSTGETGFPFDNWEEVGVTFEGVARSVDFGGVEDQIGFDNITLGSDQAGGAPVRLELSDQVLASPFLNDHFILYSVENVGEGEARNLILDATVSEPAELVDIYLQAPSCAIEPSGADEERFVCDLSAMDDWICEVEGNFGSCQLDRLPVGAIASVIVHVAADDFDASLVEVSVQEPVFTVTASASPASGGTISPSGEIQARFGEQLEFEIEPIGSFEIESVTGTCGGELEGLTFTTSPIVADCTVDASFSFTTQSLSVSVPTVAGFCAISGQVGPVQFDDSGFALGSLSNVPGGNLEFTVLTTYLEPISTWLLGDLDSYRSAEDGQIRWTADRLNVELSDGSTVDRRLPVPTESDPDPYTTATMVNVATEDPSGIPNEAEAVLYRAVLEEVAFESPGQTVEGVRLGFVANPLSADSFIRYRMRGGPSSVDIGHIALLQPSDSSVGIVDFFRQQDPPGPDLDCDERLRIPPQASLSQLDYINDGSGKLGVLVTVDDAFPEFLPALHVAPHPRIFVVVGDGSISILYRPDLQQWLAQTCLGSGQARECFPSEVIEPDGATLRFELDIEEWDIINKSTSRVFGSFEVKQYEDGARYFVEGSFSQPVDLSELFQ